MLTPYELYVKKIIPHLKAILAIKLYKKGYKQNVIATILGVTQAAVSQYLDKPLDSHRKRLKDSGLIGELYEHRLNNLIAGDVGHEEILYFFMDLWNQLLNRDVLCDIHRRHHHLVEECDICKKMLYRAVSQDRQLILQELERAYNLLVKLPGFNGIIPEVYSNIARSIENPRTLRDVAAYPGRIIPIEGSIRILSKPSFGASTHLAKILIKLSKFYPEVQAVMNVRYDEDILNAIKLIEEKYVYTSNRPKRHEDEIVDDVVKTLGKYGFSPFVFDRGGIGLEPNTYIFGRDAYDVVDKVAGLLWGLNNIE